MTSSHPPIPINLVKPIPCRPLLPIHPPNDPLNYPSLPSKPRKPGFSASFSLSTHIFPAAHLRRGPHLPVPNIPPRNVPKHEQESALNALHETFYQYWNDPSIKNGEHKGILWNVVNRYVRNGLKESTSTGITLFFAHGCGYTREIWEPILACVLSSCFAPMIDEVWSWESVEHGDAGLINSDHLSGFSDMSDNARDVTNFFLHFLPSDTLDKSPPVYLFRVPAQETERRLSSGFKRRTLIAVGHSFGANTIALGARSHPQLFSSIILLDPIAINPERKVDFKWRQKAISNVLIRKDTWESKEQAYVELSSSPYYKQWDLDTLKIFVDNAFYETTVITPTGITKSVVKPKSSAFQEALIFFGGDVLMETFAALRQLDESVRVHFIVSGAGGAPEFGPPGSQRERVWLRPKNSSNTIIKKAGHLIPLEAPMEVAQEIIQFLERYHRVPHQKPRSNL